MSEDFNGIHIMLIFLVVWIIGCMVFVPRLINLRFRGPALLFGYAASGYLVVLVVTGIANWFVDMYSSGVFSLPKNFFW